MPSALRTVVTTQRPPLTLPDAFASYLPKVQPYARIGSALAACGLHSDEPNLAPAPQNGLDAVSYTHLTLPTIYSV